MEPTMRIDQLKVQNFCCFEHATFDFSPGFNLFVGINGSGKTSLLKAVAGSLATPINGLGKSTVWLHAIDRNSRLAMVELQGRVRYEHCYPVRLEITGEVAGQARAWWMEESGPGGNQTKWEHTVFSALTAVAASIAQGGAGVLPVVAFYTAERSWKLAGIGADTAVRQQDSRLDGYNSWQDAALDTKGLETWVVAKSLERLEAVAGGSQALNGPPLDELGLVNRAVAEAVPGANGLRYDIKYRRLVLDWTNADPTAFETLSDGQRGMVALVADIARRMCLLNPQLGDTVLAQTPGIVLVDELDMHLHPAWQRLLPHVLKKAFPKVQFIAASHSPQIIGELTAEEVWLMRGKQVVGHPERAFGLDSGEVLSEIMGGQARNPDVDEELRVIRRAIDDDALPRAQALLDTLKVRVKEIPDVLEAQSAIDSLNSQEDDKA
jgi:predicted ATP-binding protein involved in virulence